MSNRSVQVIPAAPGWRVCWAMGIESEPVLGWHVVTDGDRIEVTPLSAHHLTEGRAIVYVPGRDEPTITPQNLAAYWDDVSGGAS
jgi:hypothetical protein